MIEEGALDECRRFVTAGFNPKAPAGRALGAAQLIAHVEGRMTLADAATSAVLATRRYAKRQRTWFRNRMQEWRVVDSATALEDIPPP